MDKEIEMSVEVNSLFGWRVASTEEKQVIQGILLDIAAGEKKTGRMVNVYSTILTYVGIAGAFEFLGFLKTALFEKDLVAVIILGTMVLGFLLLAWNFARMLYISIVEKPVKAYNEAIKQGRFRVLDVEIAEEMKSQNVRGNLDGHYVKVKDLQGMRCKESLRIRFANGYNGKEAILIDVLMDISSKGEKRVSRRVVLPKKNTSIATWEKGMELYSKYMK